MNTSHILVFTDRLTKGESPIEVFTEIEVFYVIRGFLNELDPGKCRHALDEYDSEAYYLLGLILKAHQSTNVMTSDELADDLEEYFSKQFSVFPQSDLKKFAYFLFQEILILKSHKVRGRDLSETLKLSEWIE